MNKVDEILKILNSRGVTLNDIAEIVMFLQKKYNEELTIEESKRALLRVLRKREVQFTILTGIEFDMLAEQKKYNHKMLENVSLRDEALYGLDEVLAYSICNLYGSIALTNFGYVDKEKVGIIDKLNTDKSQCNTFLDDIIGALAASAASQLAHHYGKRRGV